MSDLHRFRCEVSLRLRFGEWEWRYQLEGRDGAVEFWCRKISEASMKVIGPCESQFYGGFEIHRAIAGDGDGPPNHGRCGALSDRACWHDGSSTYASEVWVPRWERNQNDHEMVFRYLAAEYRDRFESKDGDQ